MTKEVNIHWFRNDLRLDDNPSLVKATENSELIPIYIFDENATVDFNHGEASLTWLYESLKLLISSVEPMFALSSMPSLLRFSFV